MAITLVRERRSHRYSFGYDDGQPLPNQEARRTFWVYSDTDDEDPLAVKAASGLPQYGDAHPTVTAALAQEIDIERDEEYLKRWLVEIRYQSRKIRGTDDSDPDADPLLITQIEVSTVQGTKVLIRDREGNRIKLPSGEPFVYECAWNELQLDFTQYRSVLDTAAYQQLALYRNAINSDTWRGFAPKTARIVAMAGRDVDINGSRYLERRISIQLRDPGDEQQPDWDEWVVNQGFYYKQTRVGVPGGDPAETYDVLLPLIDPETGTHTTKPLLLNSTGTGLLISGATPHEFQVKAYPQLPFSALNI